MKKFQFILNSLALCIVISTGGCLQESAKIQQFSLNPSKGQNLDAEKTGLVLTVMPLDSSPTAESSMLRYKVGPNEYQRDYYRRFETLPSRMITEQTRRWLADGELMNSSGSKAISNYSLSGSILEIYAQLENIKIPVALITIEYTLTRMSREGESIVLQKRYEAVKQFNKPESKLLIEAYNSCLEEILTELENDIKLKIGDQNVQ